MPFHHFSQKCLLETRSNHLKETDLPSLSTYATESIEWWNTMIKSNLGSKCVYFSLHHPETSWQELRAWPETGYGGVLLTGLILMTCSAHFLQYPEPPAQLRSGTAHSELKGPPHKSSVKKTYHRIAHRLISGGIFLIEVSSSKMTQDYIKLM